MSDIDSLPHYRIGKFAHLPIYIAREDGCWLGQAWLQPSSVLRKGALSIGGGSGEHPALVIHDPSHCVARFLYENFPEDTKKQGLVPAVEADRFTLCEGYSETDWVTEFHGYYAHYSDVLSFLDWVAIELGQFVYHLLPNFFDSVSHWHRVYGDLEVQSTMCSIPWEPYLGSGSNFFALKIHA